MNKIFLRLSILAVSFFGSWFLAYQVDWVTLFQLEEHSASLEEKLGELYWESLAKHQNEIEEDEIVSTIDTLLSRICEANDIDRDKIKLHIVESSQVNAFTLPDDYLLLYSGLIEESETEAELAGVLCHELAHMELNHIMKKLVKEVGLGVLVSMTSSGGGEVIRESLSMLTSSAFDRELEQDADFKAIDYMVEAKLDPEGLADFMYKMSAREDEMLKQLSWLSTHPSSEERALDILEYIKEKEVEDVGILSDTQWDSLKVNLRMLNTY